MNNTLIQIVHHADGDPDIKQKFLDRIQEKKLTRTEHPTSHLCVYFAAYDPRAHLVFIGHHKKSGLWLFNGGHMDPGESPRETVIREAHEEWGLTLKPSSVPNPQLVTLTKIEHPETQICQWHYDLWHFLPFDSNSFHPYDEALRTEFFSYGWKTHKEAEKFLTSHPTVEAMIYLKNRR